MSNLIQPKGSVSKEANKQSIARILSIETGDVGYIEINQPIDNFNILFDPVSEMYFYRGNATGNSLSWMRNGNELNLSTTVNNFVLNKASVIDELSSDNGASKIGGLGYINPQMFGAKGDGITDDSLAISQAIQHAIDNNIKLIFPSGTYISNNITISKPISIELSGNAYLNFTIIIKGELFTYKNKVQTSSTWTNFPVGTTIISGNFSAFNSSSTVAIKLNDTAGGSAGQGNEAGIDFSNISSATSSSLTLSTASRLAFNQAEIVELASAVKYTGTIARDSYIISGDYTSKFKVGDIIRIENIDGIDGVEAKKFYFELAKIQAISSTGITLKTRLSYSHTNPWIVQTGFISGINISGEGRIKRLEIRQCDNISITGVSIDRRIISYAYDLRMADCDSVGVYEASTSNITYCFGNSLVSNIRAGGSASTTDNAAFKIMSSPKLMVSNITTRDMTTTSGSQGNYGFYIDAIYTPYYCANSEMVVSNIYSEKPRSSVTRSIWFYGLRNSKVSGISGSQLFLQGNTDCVFSDINTPDSVLELRDLIRCNVKASVFSVTILGCDSSNFDITTKSVGTGSSLNIACRIGAGTTNPETGVAYTIGSYNRFDIVSNSASTTAITIQCANQQFPLFGSKCRDLSTVAASIASFGSNVTSPRMEGNFLQGTIPSSSGWQGVRIKGGFNLDGNYADANIKWNGYYLWMTTDGKLKYNTTVPTSDSPSGSQTIGP